MKKTGLIFIIMILVFSSNSYCQANQKCNPDVNTVISGVPYCKDVKVTTTETISPDQINNSFDPNKYKHPQNYPIIIDASQYHNPMPRTNNVQRPNMAPLQQPIPYQTVPNTPMDAVPLEIPGSGY